MITAIDPADRIGVEMEESEAGRYEIDGRPVKCPHCGNDLFWTRTTLMNTRGVTFLGFDWANKEAQNYICDRCGYVLWFLDKEA